MKKIIIIGAGDLGLQFKHLISNHSSNKIIGWLDDTKQKGEYIEGIQVFGGIEECQKMDKATIHIALAIGYKNLVFKKQLLASLVKEKCKLFSFVHPSAIIDSSAELIKGTFIYPGAIIDMNTKIGIGTVVNNGAIISHDSKIGGSCFIAPGAVISGGITIGDCCFIGAGTIIKDGVTICDEVTLGAGTLVINDIVEKGTYVGGPILRKIN